MPQSSSNRLVGEILHNLKLNQPVGQKPQTPASLPFGGSEQASAIRRASCSPFSLRWYSRLGARRLRAASKPSSTYCLRTLDTVG
jgi:hypothetical protein